MQGVGDFLLAGARFAGDQHRGVHVRQRVQQVIDFLHFLALADDALVVASFAQGVFQASQAGDVADDQNPAQKAAFAVKQGGTVDRRHLFPASAPETADLRVAQAALCLQGFLEQGETGPGAIAGAEIKALARRDIPVADAGGRAVGGDDAQRGVHRDDGVLYAAENGFQQIFVFDELTLVNLVFNGPRQDLGRRGQNVEVGIVPLAVESVFVKADEAVHASVDEKRHVQGGFHP